MTQEAASTDAGLGVRVPPPRFGVAAPDEARVITFDGGLPGFAGRRRYVLADPPGDLGPLKLLRSADDPQLGFLVLPIACDGGPIARADLETACGLLGFDAASLAVLGIVALRPEEEGDLRCTINLRAPLLVDSVRRIGVQHVLPNPAYRLRHPLPLRGDRAG